jgi:uncharacterized protein (DUF2252 family)
MTGNREQPPTTPARRTRRAAPRQPDYQAAWAPERAPAGAWTPRPWVTPAERAAAGKAARAKVPRSRHAALEIAGDRDPLAILEAQEVDRLPDLVPLRHARMAESPFTFYRGAAAVMAFDLASTPRSGLQVQASGDAHLANFGLFASPEGALVFDANDFDETLPGPWEWDVKRLAASFVIAAREVGFSAAEARRATLATVARYRRWMARFAGMRLLDVWYAKITDVDILAAATARGVGGPGDERHRRLQEIFAKARRKDGLRAAESLTGIVGEHRVILDDPPLLTHVGIDGGPEALTAVFDAYRASMAENRREMIERYRLVDVARKAVGVGSVGTRCYVVLLEGRDASDPLILQVKEATPSVLEPYVGPSTHRNQGERVVVGQRLMQATPDIFLGWTTGPAGRYFYFRQLWNMKGSVDVTTLRAPGLTLYGELCGGSLARAHARTGDAMAIAAYLGTKDTFDGAIADFAEAYADLNARDYAVFTAAIESGRLAVAPPI